MSRRTESAGKDRSDSWSGQENGARNSLLDLALRYLKVQYEVLIRGDLELGQGHDAVHDLRVAIHRYRTVLKELGVLFDAEPASELERLLAWYGDLLGNVRDLQVVRSRLTDAVGRLDPYLAPEPLGVRIDHAVVQELQQARQELDRAMRSRRYIGLMARLRTWSDIAPSTDRGKSAAYGRRRLAKAERRVTRRTARFLNLPDGDPAKDAAMHRVRSAAKRARYIAELSEPALRTAARKSIKRWMKLQDTLGDRHDAVMAADFLRRLAVASSDVPNPDGFALGVLWSREVDHAHRRW